LATVTQELPQGTVTLVYGARDDRHSNAVVLKKIMDEMTS
jgi:uncharacterized protein YeaO (DUF488 family)